MSHRRWPYKRDRMVFVFLCLTYFTWHNALEVHPCCCTRQDFILLDLEGIMPSEISQTEKGKYCMISLICGVKKKRAHRENRLVVATGGGLGGEKWVNWFCFCFSLNKLNLKIKWKKNKTNTPKKLKSWTWGPT